MRGEGCCWGKGKLDLDSRSEDWMSGGLTLPPGGTGVVEEGGEWDTKVCGYRGWEASSYWVGSPPAATRSDSISGPAAPCPLGVATLLHPIQSRKQKAMHATL